EEAREPLGLVPSDSGVEQEEQLILPLREMTNPGQQDRDVFLLLPLYDRCRMLARGSERWTGVRTGNLDEPLRSTAHWTDGLMKSGTGPPALPLTADWASHRHEAPHPPRAPATEPDRPPLTSLSGHGTSEGRHNLSSFEPNRPAP